MIFGMIQYDARGQIQGVNVNAVAESETTLSHGAKKGDSSLLVFNASKWNRGGMIALGAKKDGSDLPNRRLIGPVKEIKLMGGDYKITLASPLKVDIPSETPVRMHMNRETFEYVKSVSAKGDFVFTGGTVDVLPKAQRAGLIIITKKPVHFKDIKVEVFPLKK